MSKVALKYKNALSELENAIMKPNFKDINLAAFFKEHKLDTVLMSIFIRDKVFTKLGNGLYANNKPHEIQKLARSPSTAISMIRQYKLALRWKNDDAIQRILIKDETDNEVPTEEEIAIVTHQPIEDAPSIAAYAREISNRTDRKLMQIANQLQAYISEILSPLKSEDASSFREKKIIDVANPAYPSTSTAELKKLLYPAYLEVSKQELDNEFEEFRKWKEAKDVKD